MTQNLLLVLLSLGAAASPAAGLDVSTRTTVKPVEPFAQCFAAAEDRAAKPWSFVPKASGGGTFSNAGARGVRQPYFLDVADLGPLREIRLTAPDASVLRAVDQCL